MSGLCRSKGVGLSAIGPGDDASEGAFDFDIGAGEAFAGGGVAHDPFQPQDSWAWGGWSDLFPFALDLTLTSFFLGPEEGDG